MQTSFHRAIKVCIYLASILLCALPLSPVLADTISIIGNHASLSFPDRIEFYISAKSGADIDRATLIYGTSADLLCASPSARQDIAFAATPMVYLTWTWDLNLGGILPPGTEVWWQWELHDASGATTLTDVKKLTIEDPAYNWQMLQQGNVTVYWGKGPASFGAFLLNETVTSLPRLAAASGIQYTGKVRLMVYPSPKEVLDAAPRLPDWIGGVTFPEYGTVMVAIGPTETQWAQSVIPHELEHLVTARRIFNCQENELPTWLSEGLAMFAEGPVSYHDKDLVMTALQQKSLTALVLLKKGFSADSGVAAQDYAESGMVVTYLINTYGPKKMDQVLGLFQQATLLDAAFTQVYGLDTQGIDDTWQASLGFAPESGISTPALAYTATPMVIPTLALWTAEVAQAATAVLTPTQPAAPTRAQLTATPPAVQVAPVFTKAASSSPAPAGNPNRLPGWPVAAGLVAGVAGLAILWIIIRFRKQKGG